MYPNVDPSMRIRIYIHSLEKLLGGEGAVVEAAKLDSRAVAGDFVAMRRIAQVARQSEAATEGIYAGAVAVVVDEVRPLGSTLGVLQAAVAVWPRGRSRVRSYIDIRRRWLVCGCVYTGQMCRVWIALCVTRLE